MELMAFFLVGMMMNLRIQSLIHPTLTECYHCNWQYQWRRPSGACEVASSNNFQNNCLMPRYTISMNIDTSLDDNSNNDENTTKFNVILTANQNKRQQKFLHSESTKAKISAANKGKKPWNVGLHQSEETKQKIRNSVRRRLEAEKEKAAKERNMTVSQFDQWCNDQKMEQYRDWRRSRAITDEIMRQRRSEQMKLNWRNPVLREKYSKRVYQKLSVESRQKISEAVKQVWKSRKKLQNTQNFSSIVHSSKRNRELQNLVSINQHRIQSSISTSIHVVADSLLHDDAGMIEELNGSIGNINVTSQLEDIHSLVENTGLDTGTKQFLSAKNIKTVEPSSCEVEKKESSCPPTRKKKNFSMPDTSLLKIILFEMNNDDDMFESYDNQR
jgi:hypothetical protein